MIDHAPHCSGYPCTCFNQGTYGSVQAEQVRRKAQAKLDADRRSNMVGLVVNGAYTILTVWAAYALVNTNWLLAMALGVMGGLQLLGMVQEIRKL